MHTCDFTVMFFCLILVIHPVDYVYRSLGCNIQLLDQTSDEAQMILQYIHNTGKFAPMYNILFLGVGVKYSYNMYLNVVFYAYICTVQGGGLN